MARSVLDSLERKVGELENSTKILKQEMNLLRLGGAPQDNSSMTATQNGDSPTLEMEMFKNRIFNLEALMQQQQRGRSSMIPGPQANPAGPYQYGPGGLMQGSQPYGTPVYGNSTGLGLGRVPGGMGYAPFHQGYMQPGLQQQPYYPHIRVHQPMN